MNTRAVLKVIESVVREELSRQDLIITESTKAEDVPGWDSLAHTRIILALESALDRAISIEDTYYATNVGELAALFN